jgi:REP element-mobilizing transposase RayT
MPKRDYIEFQDRSSVKAYLITFRTYGTWMPGDERGSVDRRYQNRFGTSKIAASDEKVRRREGLLKHKPFLLGLAERVIVEKAIREVCRVRGYVLIALNVRTNHVHIVVSSAGAPERVMDSFKAYATKALRTAGLATIEQSIWSRHGSTRYLWAEEHVAAAVEYVDNGQGGELPTFE